MSKNDAVAANRLYIKMFIGIVELRIAYKAKIVELHVYCGVCKSVTERLERTNIYQNVCLSLVFAIQKIYYTDQSKK